MCSERENLVEAWGLCRVHEIIAKSVTVVRYNKKGKGWLCVGGLTEEKT